MRKKTHICNKMAFMYIETSAACVVFVGFVTSEVTSMKGVIAEAQTKGFPFFTFLNRFEKINCEKHVRFSNTAELIKHSTAKNTASI